MDSSRFFPRAFSLFFRRKIKRGDFKFHSPMWDHVSPEAKDLIKRLLVVDPDKRLDAAGALKHAWILTSDHLLQKRDLAGTVEEMKKYEGGKGLKKGKGGGTGAGDYGNRSSRAHSHGLNMPFDHCISRQCICIRARSSLPSVLRLMTSPNRFRLRLAQVQRQTEISRCCQGSDSHAPLEGKLYEWEARRLDRGRGGDGRERAPRGLQARQGQHLGDQCCGHCLEGGKWVRL